MNKNFIEIVFTSSGKYAPFAATTALSILKNTNEQVRFHVLTENFKSEDKKIVTDFILNFPNASIEFVDITEKLKLFEGAYLSWFSSFIPYARILIPQLITVPKAIYLDLDTIVCCDIRELWNTDLCVNGKEYALMAKRSSENYRKRVVELCHALNLDSNHIYFSSGVLVMNLVKWEEDKIAEKCIEIAKQCEKIKFLDQDVLNIYFDNNNYVPLQTEYNSYPVMVTEEEKKYFEPKIIHYAGPKKPWNNPEMYKADVFWFYAKQTPYYKTFFRPLKRKYVINKIKQKVKQRIKPLIKPLWIRIKSYPKPAN
jgi:lipopolysaccharide biosynthesis glycosyltransferase